MYISDESNEEENRPKSGYDEVDLEYQKQFNTPSESKQSSDVSMHSEKDVNKQEDWEKELSLLLKSDASLDFALDYIPDKEWNKILNFIQQTLSKDREVLKGRIEGMKKEVPKWNSKKLSANVVVVENESYNQALEDVIKIIIDTQE